MNSELDPKSYKLSGEHFYKFIQCPHWIWYDIYGDETKKGVMPPLIEMLQKNGIKHAREVIKSRVFEEIKPELFRDLDEAFLATLDLLKQGKNVYHGVLMDKHWVGMPDLLEARPIAMAGEGAKSNFGDYYYVAYDIKNIGDVRDEYKFQLVFYSLILEKIQGIRPKEAYIINAQGEERSFVIDDFLDQFHLSLDQVERILDGEKPAPFLKSGCKRSPWYDLCLEETKGCDDVSLIYRLSQNDQRRLYDIGIKTVRDLADQDVTHMQSELEDWSFDKIIRFHNQANALVTGQPMILKKNQFPIVANEIYFDIESDPTENIDYLLGVLHRTSDGETKYISFLARDKADEKRIWEEFLVFIEKLEDFVIYHYSYYEKEVFRRLSNAYGISQELDQKFMSHTIDLHESVIQSAVLPIYFYSLKDIAKFLGFKWQAEDAGGAQSVVWYNDWLHTGDHTVMDKILRYNEDDVRATLFVKDWLEDQKPRTSKEKIPDELLKE